MDVQQCLAQAKQAEQQKQWSQAAELYTKVLEVLPDHQSAKGQLAWCLSRAKEYSQAISVLQDLAQRQPEVAKWPYMIGYQHHEQQKHQPLPAVSSLTYGSGPCEHFRSLVEGFQP